MLHPSMKMLHDTIKHLINNQTEAIKTKGAMSQQQIRSTKYLTVKSRDASAY